MINFSANDFFADLDRKYPDRHKKIHKAPCKNCPSMSPHVDEETEDFKKCSDEYLISEVLFVCYLRNSKLCKGLCDNLSINQDKIYKFYENEQNKTRAQD